MNPEQKIQMMRQMLLIRHFELVAQTQFQAGKVPGFCHIYVGEEAIAVGVCQALTLKDFIVSTHRGHGHCLAKGAAPDKLMAELYGKETGYCRGRGGSMHIFARELGILGTNGIVGGGLPLALGGAMHAKLQKTQQVTVCFFGDGAANQGTFHESLNLAAIQRLPVIFVCENNLYATATRMNEVTLTQNIADRAASYGMPGCVLDGNKVLEVYDAAIQAVTHARSGQGPSLLECKTYRHFGHYVGENANYRPQQEVDEWLKKDPIPQFARHLRDENLLSSEQFDRMEEAVKNQIQQAERFASESPFPQSEEVLGHVFSE